MLRRKGQCNARIKLSPTDDFLAETNAHTHPPSQTKCEIAKVKANLKRKAETTHDTSRQILAAELQNIPEDAAVNLPSMNTLSRNIRAARQERDLPQNPLNRQAIPILPNNYQVTSTGDQFLAYDSGVGDANRILIFASPQSIRLLGRSSHWFADGTFKVCPELFFQLYTVHAHDNGRIFPCAFALLPNKTQGTYDRFFTEIFRMVQPHGNGPDDVLIDFERSAINALLNQNPNLEAKGCFYHLCSSVWKHIQDLGLVVHYLADAQFAILLRMIAATAFLPPADVIQGFDDLCDEIRNLYQAEADDLLEYFEDTYIGRFRRNAPRRPPLFPIVLWNMYHRTDDELPRTNNSVEGWHRGFQSHVTACHPIFWKFLDILKREEGLVRVSILQHLGGHPPPPQRRRYVDCNRRILAIVDDYPNRQTIPYLRSIAHNLSF